MISYWWWHRVSFSFSKYFLNRYFIRDVNFLQQNFLSLSQSICWWNCCCLREENLRKSIKRKKGILWKFCNNSCNLINTKGIFMVSSTTFESLTNLNFSWLKFFILRCPNGIICVSWQLIFCPQKFLSPWWTMLQERYNYELGWHNFALFFRAS